MVTPKGVIYRQFGMKITPFGVTTTPFGLLIFNIVAIAIIQPKLLFKGMCSTVPKYLKY